MMNRTEHARRICREITAKVGESAPAGLGRWPETWRLVEEPSNVFLDALDKWAAGDDTPETQEDLETAVAALLAAWAGAGTLYQAAEGAGTREVDRAHA